MKIAYIIESLATTGGVERMITEKANIFSEQYGFEVTILVCNQPHNQPNSFQLSASVKQIYLGISFYSQYKYKYPKRLWAKFILYRKIKNKITEIVQRLNPDILLGVGHFEADLICSIDCKAKKIIESHEPRFLTKSGLTLNHTFITKAYYHLYRIIYLRTIERKADAIVTLTEGDKKLWKRARRVEVIPNFSTMPVHCVSTCTTKRIISIGRLSREKGYERLIEAWGMVCHKYPDWHLDIYGEGYMYNSLMTLTKLYNVCNLTVNKFTPYISQEYANSSICAVTSFFEGFSLVILEAMKHGVPCVAFNCPFGPGSIINDSHNGFLINDGDIKMFADRLCRLIEDEKLRKQFSINAIEKSKSFDVDIIINKWIDLFEKITNK